MVDWGKIFDHLHTTAKAVVVLKQGYDTATLFTSLATINRDRSMDQLAQYVNQLPHQEFDEFQVAFVNFAAYLIDFKQKIRAMELYPWPKILETEKFVQSRGFMHWAETRRGRQIIMLLTSKR